MMITLPSFVVSVVAAGEIFYCIAGLTFPLLIVTLLLPLFFLLPPVRLIHDDAPSAAQEQQMDQRMHKYAIVMTPGPTRPTRQLSQSQNRPQRADTLGWVDEFVAFGGWFTSAESQRHMEGEEVWFDCGEQGRMQQQLWALEQKIKQMEEADRTQEDAHRSHVRRYLDAMEDLRLELQGERAARQAHAQQLEDLRAHVADEVTTGVQVQLHDNNQSVQQALQSMDNKILILTSNEVRNLMAVSHNICTPKKQFLRLSSYYGSYGALRAWLSRYIYIKSMKLVYKSSRDGFKYSTFLDKIDGVSRLLLLIRDGPEHLIASIIDGPLTLPQDPTSFIFTPCVVSFYAISGRVETPTKMAIPERWRMSIARPHWRARWSSPPPKRRYGRCPSDRPIGEEDTTHKSKVAINGWSSSS
ncbi:unnamed protein product [Vitrella brassicaformis CCMP3155]|uniref:TLDc domain-containing protein n=1 Tax=Vitrella brassicaformis (strain CCMP3155) TaxID=1169540 RepID=A0A0G4H2G6_VITBC|nr:unnamed protein product [Vitrella brassicaformis CCMP3155]|eukprot:CEM37814.1 unnamed protein product [Vitrella brassicaformis CCMP3155]